MAKDIKIKLDLSKYTAPTSDDIKAAKQYILQREEYAQVLEEKVDGELEDAAARIVAICYRYNVDPKQLVFSSSYNEDMMDEISEVMDEIEGEIYDQIFEYSTQATNNRSIMSALALWMATLGRGNRNLRDTLDGYLFKFMKDIEASVAAYRFMGVSQTDAVTKIRSNLHNIYNQPEVLTAFRRRQDFNATYIRLGGVQPGAVGISNNGSTNVISMSRITLQMAWMRAHIQELQEDKGVAGLYVLRGSLFDCPFCDEQVGWHPIEDALRILPIHPHCCCYAIPIYRKDGADFDSKNLQTNSPQTSLVNDLPDELFDIYTKNGVSFKIAKEYDTKKNDYKDLLSIAEFYASSGKQVALLKPYHFKSKEYSAVFGSLAGTNYWKKCPDILVDNDFYEYESYVRPWNRRKVSNMLSHGLVQSDRVIIDKEGSNEGLIRNMIEGRLKNGDNVIASISLFDNGSVEDFFVNGKFVK